MHKWAAIKAICKTLEYTPLNITHENASVFIANTLTELNLLSLSLFPSYSSRSQQSTDSTEIFADVRSLVIWEMYDTSVSCLGEYQPKARFASPPSH